MMGLLVAFIIISGLSSGVAQGMSMIQPKDYHSIYYGGEDCDINMLGARSHEWFGYYHFVQSIQRASIFLLGFVFACIFISVDWQGVVLLIASIFLLSWSSFEIGYSKARWNKFSTKRENIDFLDRYDTIPTERSEVTGMGFLIVFWGRLIIGFLLIVLGLCYGII